MRVIKSMRGTGADQPVVVVKLGKLNGAKGVESFSFQGEPYREGGVHG